MLGLFFIFSSPNISVHHAREITQHLNSCIWHGDTDEYCCSEGQSCHQKMSAKMTEDKLLVPLPRLVSGWFRISEPNISHLRVIRGANRRRPKRKVIIFTKQVDQLVCNNSSRKARFTCEYSHRLFVRIEGRFRQMEISIRHVFSVKMVYEPIDVLAICILGFSECSSVRCDVVTPQSRR